MKIRTKQRYAGLAIALVSAGFTAFNWKTAVTEGYFYVKSSLLFPALFFVGIAMIFFPSYKEERLSRGEDISGLKGFKLLTLRWWIILLIGLLAGGVNYLLLDSLL